VINQSYQKFDLTQQITIQQTYDEIYTLHCETWQFGHSSCQCSIAATALATLLLACWLMQQNYTHQYQDNRLTVLTAPQ